MKILCRAIVFLLSLMALVCTATAGEQSPQPKVFTRRVKVVEEFMSLMVERQLADSATKSKLAEIDRKMLALLAPYYFETLGVDKNLVTINKYSPDGFRVVSEKGAYVGVKLLRKTYAGPTLIVFKTAEVNGRFFIEPSSLNLAGDNDPSFVTPWFYAAEQHDVDIENIPLPEIGTPTLAPVMPATRELVDSEGVALVKQLTRYLANKHQLGAAERQAVFRREILPHLARAYTNIYGIDLAYYEDITIDNIKNYQMTGIADAHVVMSCAGCLYERYYFKIVMEEGQAKIMPTGVDNCRKTISPVWLRE